MLRELDIIITSTSEPAGDSDLGASGSFHPDDSLSYYSWSTYVHSVGNTDSLAHVIIDRPLARS